jgi:asparagine synthase (glutamine-hydrolysing)
MCGIAGLLFKKPIAEESIKKFTLSSDLINHRGPDHKGIYRDEKVLLIHFRLSIIDLDPRSHQPMESQDKSAIMVYNGELYNYANIKSQYQIQTKTSSDSEVLLESFLKTNGKVAESWNGIFASVIYERQKKKLHIIRDRFGVKPLYLYEDENVIAFASEAKVILDWLPEFTLNTRVLNQFIWFGNTTGVESHVKGLIKVDKGVTTTFKISDDFKRTKKTFWSIHDIQKVNISESSAIKRTKELLQQAVSRQLVADVPVGILLSGGIDSSSIVALASLSSSKKLDTYSIEYDYNIGGKSELQKAALIAKKYQTNHHELIVTTDDVKDIFEKLVFQYDEPFADPASIPLYQLAKACSKDKRVILQGDGGDEFFAGYRRYNAMTSYQFWRSASKIYPLIPDKRWKERMKRIDFVYGQKEFSKTLAFYMTEEVPYKTPYSIFSDELRINLAKENFSEDYEVFVSHLKGQDKVQQMLYADTEILLPNRYLEKVDKATMLESIEARVPFLDNDLAQFALALPSYQKVKKGQKKYLLKKAMEELVPKEILYGPKRGFDVPFREWLRTDLYDFAKEQFMNVDSRILNGTALLKTLELHKSRKVDYSTLLWKGLVLAYWLRYYQNKLVLG